MKRKVVHLKKPDYVMPYVPAIKTKGGTIVWLAGMTAVPMYHRHPHVPEEVAVPQDVKEQTRRAIRQMEATLKACGGSLKDIVRIVRYLKDIKDQDAANKVFNEVFGDDKPTTTTVQVASLVAPDILIELEGTAVIDD